MWPKKWYPTPQDILQGIPQLKNFTSFHWLGLGIFALSIFQFLYRKTVQPLFCKMGIREKFVIPFSMALWHVSFLLVCLPLVALSLDGNIFGGWVTRLDKELALCKVLDSVDYVIRRQKTLYLIIVSFILHEILTILFDTGFRSIEFFKKQVFLGILALTYNPECTKLGVVLYFISNVCTVMEFGSKALYFAGQYTKSTVVLIFSKVFCAASVLLWIYTHLYVYPVFLMYNKSINSSMMRAQLNFLITLDLLIWIYLLVNIVTSTFTRMMFSYVLPSDNRPATLTYFLFGSDPVILWFGRVQSDSNIILNEEDVFMSAPQRQLLRLRSIIRCRNSIMRIVKKNRAKKEERRMSEERRTSEEIDEEFDKLQFRRTWSDPIITVPKPYPFNTRQPTWAEVLKPLPPKSPPQKSNPPKSARKNSPCPKLPRLGRSTLPCPDPARSGRSTSPCTDRAANPSSSSPGCSRVKD